MATQPDHHAKPHLVDETDENSSSLDGTLEDLRVALNKTGTWEERRRQAFIEAQREDTRSSYGRSVIQTFCVVVIFFAFTGCITLLFTDGSRLKPLIEFVQAIGSVITPIVGFIVGHYFATKDSR